MRYILLAFAFVTLGGCVSVTPTRAESMSDQGLCDLVNPRKFITTFQEREVIYKELESREVTCDFLSVEK